MLMLMLMLATQVLEELAEAKLHSTRELQAARTDLKNAQEEFNSARQMGLQRQNELQSEMNQLKMSYEMREKDVDRLNQVCVCVFARACVCVFV